MSINLTQEFVFETDDIDSLEQILDPILRVLFRKGRYQKTEHRMRLQIAGDTVPVTPTCFLDGRYDNYDTSQPMMLPMSEIVPDSIVNDTVVLLEIDRMYGGTSQLKAAGEDYYFDDRDAAAKASCAHRIEPRPTRRWITSIWDSDHENTHLKEDEVFVARGYADLVREAIKLCRFANKDKFRDEFSEVEPDTDGSVEIGFRIESRPRALDFSLVHIIYGK